MVSAANFPSSTGLAVGRHGERSGPFARDRMQKWFWIVLLTVVCGTSSRVLRLIRRSFPLWLFFGRHFPSIFGRLAHHLAFLNCRLASLTVPAYAQIVRSTGTGRPARTLEAFPETDKDSYARAFSFAAQCRYGRLKTVGSTVDESSGSTGRPFNWVRSGDELSEVHRNIANYIRFCFPVANLFCINAFSMGAWATGTNFSTAMRKIAIVKSPGPDVETVISTLKTFGSGFDYLITAYPPFLKTLCDELDARGIPTGEYRLYGMVAGEPMTEALRDHLLRRFQTVLSGYGASDVAIGLGAETGFTVALRKAIGVNAQLRHALLGHGENRVPMIFQYNPLEVYVEAKDDSELLFTLTDSKVMSPKLRYNLRDEGRVLSFGQVAAAMRKHAGAGAFGPEAHTRILKLPVLFLFGRSDSTISVMGANIYPQDVEHGLYADPELARRISGFCLSLDEQRDLRSLPTVHVELKDVPGAEAPRHFETRLSHAVTAYLTKVSRDFANARLEDPETTMIQMRCYGGGEGPFAEDKARIKNRYLVGTTAHAARA